MDNLINDFKHWANENDMLADKKREVLNHKEQILALLNEGFTLKLIYRYLAEKKLITSCYDNFRKHVNKLLESNKEINKNLTADIKLKEAESQKIKHESEAEYKLTQHKKNIKLKQQNQLDNPKDTHEPKIGRTEPIPRFVHNSVPPPMSELV